MTRTPRLVAVVAALACAHAAGAQDARPLRPRLHLGFLAGASSPLGDYADFTQLGVHAGTRFGVSVPAWPVALHAEAQWHRFSRKSAFRVPQGNTIPLEVVPLTVNLDVGRTRGEPGAYATVGAGAYYLRPDRRSNGRLGFTAGVGSAFQIGRREGFLELRVHRVGDSDETGEDPISFVPISLGIRF